MKHTQYRKKIHVHGKRWFNRNKGHTYHSAEITVDDKPVEGIGYSYVYGQQYLYSALEKLASSRIIPPPEHTMSPNYYAEKHGINITHEVEDVNRKKDLKSVDNMYGILA